MTVPPVLPPPAVNADAEHLRILSICWYVVAALHGLGACFLLLYVGFGVILSVVGAAAGTAAGHAAHDPAASIVGMPFLGMGMMVGCFGGFLMLVVSTIGFLHFKTGQALQRRRNITLCYVMAAIACLGFPAGTVLGVFTFVVLSRPSVRGSFV